MGASVTLHFNAAKLHSHSLPFTQAADHSWQTPVTPASRQKWAQHTRPMSNIIGNHGGQQQDFESPIALGA
jgi:hypothetical protein